MPGKEVRVKVEWLVLGVVVVVIFLAILFFARDVIAPTRAEDEKEEAKVSSAGPKTPIRVEYSEDLAFFDQNGEPLIWYYRSPEGGFELFRGSYQAPMTHPRYSDVDLFAVTPTVVREIEASFSPAPRTAPAPGRPKVRSNSPRPSPALPIDVPSPAVPSRPGSRTFTIPAETLLDVFIEQQLSTKSNKTGDTFGVLLARDLVIDGETVLRQGTKLTGRIAELKQPGRFKGVAKLTLVLDRIGLGDSGSEIRTLPLSMERDPSRGKDVAIIGGAAGAGAIIGGVTGGGKGAAKGGILGGVGGFVADAFTKGDDLELVYQALLTFKTAAPATVTRR